MNKFEAATILLGGSLGDTDASRLPDNAMVIAADSGYRHAKTLGLHVDLLIGDMDSISGNDLAEAKKNEVKIVQLPIHKNETDLEAALSCAKARSIKNVTIIGASFFENRIDHFLANIIAPTNLCIVDMSCRFLIGQTIISVVHDEINVHGTPGETISLLPIAGPVRGVNGSGFLWALNDLDIEQGSSAAMSNQLTGCSGNISVKSGTLLVVQTGAIGPPLPEQLLDPNDAPSRSLNGGDSNDR